MNSILQTDILILGAGCGGSSVANRLRRQNANIDITIVEEKQEHFIGLIWFKYIFGQAKKKDCSIPVKDLIPRSSKLIQDSARNIDPSGNKVILNNGNTIIYKALIIATGAIANFDAIKGYREARALGGAFSIFDQSSGEAMMAAIQRQKPSTVLFSYPEGPVKCPGASLKTLFAWKQEARENKFQFFSAQQSVFPIPAYANLINQRLKQLGVKAKFNYKLLSLDGNHATFGNFDDQQKIINEVVADFDFVHVTPEFKISGFLLNSDLTSQDGSWLDVDKFKLQHKRYPNIFGIGDVISTPNTKTATAAFHQSKVLATNVLEFLNNSPLTKSYDGYSICPLSLEKGKTVLARYNYQETEVPIHSLPGPRKNNRLSWHYSTYLYPVIYKHLGLKGRIPL